MLSPLLMTYFTFCVRIQLLYMLLLLLLLDEKFVVVVAARKFAAFSRLQYGNMGITGFEDDINGDNQGIRSNNILSCVVVVGALWKHLNSYYTWEFGISARFRTFIVDTLLV